MEKRNTITPDRTPCITCGSPGDIIIADEVYCSKHAKVAYDADRIASKATLEKTASLHRSSEEKG